MSDNEFIDLIINDAVELQVRYGLPAAAIIAQACLETGYGSHVVKDMKTGQYSYNLFNIKGKGTAGQVTVNTYEYVNGVRKNATVNFRAYNSFRESFEDYASLITGSTRYSGAVQAGQDPSGYAYALQQSGYATDPGYARKIVSIMNKYKLKERVEQFLWD